MILRPILFTLLLLASATGAERPNILLITADDLGLQLLCYGDKHIQTPHLDTLAASGVRFETAYIAQSSCSPSRASIFTGMFPHSHGHIGLAKPKNPPLHSQLHSQTIPALLKATGYRTGIIGKLHVNPASAFPFDFKVNNEQIGEGGSRNAQGVAREMAKFLAQDPKRPFFLMVNDADPHRVCEPQIGGLPEKPFLKGAVPEWPFQKVRDDQILTDAANYYNCVRRLDTCVGLVLAELKKAGKEQESLVIFLSDNGPPLARSKTTCYEAGLRTPFLLRWPGVTKPGLVSESFVSSVDILPTILDAVGLPVPAQVQGRSLRGVAGGDNTGWRTTLAGEFHQHGESPFFPRRSLRDSRYHVIHNLLAGKLTLNIGVDGATAPQVAASAAYKDTPAQQAMARAANPPEWELYDLQSDPGEFQNLADDPAHAGTLKRMQGLLLEWRKETQDSFLDPALLEKRHREVNTASDAPDPKAPSKKKGKKSAK
ncbi:MAG: sulfatase [Verrucomicrobiales bacterium]